MPAAKQTSRIIGNIRDDRLRRCTSFEITIRIREADYRASVCNIEESRIRPRRIEGDAERSIESGCKRRCHRGFAIGSDPAKNLNFTCLTFGKKDVAIWRRLNLARVVKSACVEFDAESSGGLRQHIGRTRN